VIPHPIIIAAIVQPGATVAGSISTPSANVVTWILGGPDDDALPTGVICPPRKPKPVLGAHAVPVLDELVSRKPRWN
jgi:hypothetical protein